MSGKVLGLVGSGRIALAVARRAQGFGMRLAYTGRRRNEIFEAATGACYLDKKELLASSDFVSLHIPLTPETRHYMAAADLALMPPHAVLVNTARGAVVDEEALVEALEGGRPGGAGLDVFEREPHAHPGLRMLPNVLMTPHRGVATPDSLIDMGEACAHKIFDALDGRLPQDCLNPHARKA
ncbi:MULTISPECIES: NAD(P)-dependent oxidoreductase [Desulfovibrio]|uniref:D-isomer specific 2-hydroxyacid dehydrogenase, NAD binding domain n=1 Tax=Desulfovibrio desulfuricans TaxID=876 RepID=A0AA94HSX2_DESDE|nr:MULTISPECIES: NAD(P)-dependent oxidoreductase [Desulfovibrio]SFW48740.1 D-isomer specific 2-hydroxyacid dehydrogenase, NAD binding domain [Desulfovibrio desulfuricans]SPD36414.1 D-isomer specific 2-hydroxyacid dehydrogenase, NAD binding domain [Desulfovibrio sp. G11]